MQRSHNVSIMVYIECRLYNQSSLFDTHLIQFEIMPLLPSTLDLSCAVQTSSQLPPNDSRTLSSGVGQYSSNARTALRVSAVILFGVGVLLGIHERRLSSSAFLVSRTLTAFITLLNAHRLSVMNALVDSPREKIRRKGKQTLMHNLCSCIGHEVGVLFGMLTSYCKYCK